MDTELWHAESNALSSSEETLQLFRELEFFQAPFFFVGAMMALQGDKVVISEKFKLALLAGIFGMSGTGALKEDKVALELSKIREALLVAVEKVKDHDRRIDNLETLFLRQTR